MLENLAAKGIKRLVGPPLADIEVCKLYKPGDVGRLVVVGDEYGLATGAIFMKNTVPDWLVSGYRDLPADPTVKNSPHYFGCAFDVMVGSVMRQIQFVEMAVKTTGLFNRGGIYIGRNTCHIDQCDEAWMQKYNGAKFWVWHDKKYVGFFNFSEASQYALSIVTPGDRDDR